MSPNEAGIIVELKKKTVLVMTNELNFYETDRRPHMAVGLKIDDIRGVASDRRKSFIKMVSIISSFAAVILFVLFAFNLSDEEEYAYIGIDINPAVELAVDKSCRVVRVLPLNDDAKKMLYLLELERKPVQDAVETIINRTKKLDTEKEKKYVLITGVLDGKYEHNIKDKKRLVKLLDSLEKMEPNKEKDSFILVTAQMENDDRDAAYKEGLSMGRYFIKLKAKEAGLNISDRDIKEKSITELIESLGLVHGGKGRNISTYDTNSNNKDDERDIMSTATYLNTITVKVSPQSSDKVTTPKPSAIGTLTHTIRTLVTPVITPTAVYYEKGHGALSVTPSYNPTPLDEASSTIRNTTVSISTLPHFNTPSNILEATPSATATSVPDVEVVGFTLVNTDTRKDIKDLTDEQTIYLSESVRNFTVRANISASPLKVVMGLNGSTRTENMYPYSLTSSVSGDYYPWRPYPGTYTISATPYHLINGVEVLGTTKTIIVHVKAERPK